MKTTTVVITQLAMGAYRQRFLDELVKQSPANWAISFLVGDVYFDRSIRTAVSSPLVQRNVSNVYLFRRRIAWQHGVVWRGVRANVAVLELNPRILSVWVCLIARWSLRKPSILWGHAWPRAGRTSRSAVLRVFMRQFAAGVGYYTARDASEASSRAHSGAAVGVIPNSLYTRSELVIIPDDRVAVLSVGRLVASKKPALLVRAYAEARAMRPQLGPLVLVGEGPDRDDVEALAFSCGVGSEVRFAGHVNDARELATLYGKSFCAVSSGYVGLSATQAAGFGVPLIYPTEDPHAPEASILDRTNSIPFASDSSTALAGAIVDAYDRRHDWAERAQEIQDPVLENYTAESMAEGFLDLVGRVIG